MDYKYYFGTFGISTVLFIFGPASLRGQNLYPASGDALIHRLTIGTGGGGFNPNTALGDSALFFNGSALYNTAVGMRTLVQNSGGQENTALGYQALYNNTSSNINVAAGSGALYSNLSGYGNVALGQNALYNNNSGSFAGWDGTYNSGVGAYAMFSNIYGYQNVAFGYYAMSNSTSAVYSNTAFGALSLATNSSGVYNAGLGADADIAYSNLSYSTAVGYGAVATASGSIVIGNTSVTSIGGYAGWTTFSDGRYKKNISRNVPGLAFINQLDPVIYTLDVEGIESRLHANKNIEGPDGRPMPDPMANPVMQQAKLEKSRILHTGFIAQDVEKAAESLGYQFSGIDHPKNDQQSFYGLRYSEFVAPLVKAVQELSAENDSLKATNDRLEARLDRIKLQLGIDSNARISAALAPGAARRFQNQHNPFSQTILINYFVPQNPGLASLQIASMNGEIIKTTAVSGYGHRQVNVQRADLDAGTYTRKMVVVK
jgi:hypothetical protein